MKSERRRVRAVIDAVRYGLGYEPLYGKKGKPYRGLPLHHEHESGRVAPRT